MRKVFSANFAKVAVIAVALAVAATCTVAGTLAAFSATYTWNAETATGSAYSDTDYSLDLFGGRTIVPGDSGSAVLGGPDFGDSVSATASSSGACPSGAWATRACPSCSMSRTRKGICIRIPSIRRTRFPTGFRRHGLTARAKEFPSAV